MELKLGEIVDLYEFNVKVEDGISILVKSKGKGDKEKVGLLWLMDFN